jgi:Na+/proline symporter
VFRIGPAYPPGLVAENIVFWLVLFAWAGLGASIGPLPSWHFTGKKLTKRVSLQGY